MQETRWLLEGVERPDADALDVYRRNDGYGGAWRAFDEIDPAAIIDEVEASGLRGQGGAWRPVGARWRRAAETNIQALIVDMTESEAGRFRDRKLVERLPHRLIEGALIAAHALAANEVYLCIRADWRRARTVLAQALDEARAAGWIGRGLGRSAHEVRFHVHPVPGPLPARGGDHLLPNLIECSRPEPRATSAIDEMPTLFGAPVIVHTAATLGYLPSILARGADEFRALGSGDYPGTVSLSVSGHVQRPGLFEVEIGSGSFGDIIDDLAGGAVSDGEICALFSDGAPPLVGEAIWTAPVDPAQWSHPGGGSQQGTFGSGTLIVGDESVAPVEMAAKWLEQAADLGCGQCPACREGSAWLAMQLQRLRQGGQSIVDLPAFRSRLDEMATAESEGLTICGHATVAAQVTTGLLQIAPDDVMRQAAAGADEQTNDPALRTADSIHLRF